jgi:hypothetical protein
MAVVVHPLFRKGVPWVSREQSLCYLYLKPKTGVLVESSERQALGGGNFFVLLAGFQDRVF